MVVFPQFCVADKNPVRRKKRCHQARDPVPPFPVPQIRARKGEEGGKAEPPETGSFPLRRQGCGVARRGGVELLEPFPEGHLLEIADWMASGRARPKRNAECGLSDLGQSFLNSALPAGFYPPRLVVRALFNEPCGDSPGGHGWGGGAAGVFAWWCSHNFA